MLTFKISAPGKIILCGDYTMMYGKEIVLASLDRRTTLEFYELHKDSTNIIDIKFPDVDLWLHVPLRLCLNFISSKNFINIIGNSKRLLKEVQYFITSNGLWCTYEQKFSLQIFFFLFLYIVHQEQLDIKSFHVHVTTQLPINAGLGSSSSFAVCLAACFLHWARLQKGVHDQFNMCDLNKISKYASLCDEVVQNIELEKDSYICTYGGIIRFQYAGPEIRKAKFLVNMSKINILLIDSKSRQNKREQMSQLACMMHCFPREINAILNIIDSLSKQACDILVKIKNVQDYLQLVMSYQELGVSFFCDFLISLCIFK